MPVAVPLIGLAASYVGSKFGKKATDAAQKRSPEEATALTGAQGAGTALGAQGAQQFQTGTGIQEQGQSTLAGPTSYYSRLLSGNRASQSQAVAAPRAAITDTYRGAERNLERSGVRGAARDVAKGELGRQRAGQISSLITGVQPGAAAALTSIGENQTGQGAGIAGQGSSATGASGGIFGNLLGQGTSNRYYARGEGEKFGQGFGGLIFDLLSQSMKARGGTRGSFSFGGGIPGGE